MYRSFSLKNSFSKFETYDSPLRHLRTRFVSKGADSKLGIKLPRLNSHKITAKKRISDPDKACEAYATLKAKRKLKQETHSEFLGIVFAKKKFIVSKKLTRLPKLVSKECQT